MQPLVQLLPINKAAACSHVSSVFFRIFCRSLAYTDRRARQFIWTVSVSVIYFLCKYSECVRYSREYKTIRILCRSLAYTDSFSIASEEQNSSFGLSPLALSTFYVSTLSVFTTVMNIKQCQIVLLSSQDGKMPFGTIGLIKFSWDSSKQVTTSFTIHKCLLSVSKALVVVIIWYMACSKLWGKEVGVAIKSASVNGCGLLLDRLEITLIAKTLFFRKKWLVRNIWDRFK